MGEGRKRLGCDTEVSAAHSLRQLRVRYRF